MKLSEVQFDLVSSTQGFTKRASLCACALSQPILDYFYHFPCVYMCMRERDWESDSERERRCVFERDHCTSGYSIFYLDIFQPDSSELSTALSLYHKFLSIGLITVWRNERRKGKEMYSVTS